MSRRPHQKLTKQSRKCIHARVIKTSYWDKKKAQYVNTWHCAKCGIVVPPGQVTFFETERPVAKYQCGASS